MGSMVRSILVVVAVALGILALPALTLSGSAQAVDSGVLVVSPSSGDLNTPVDVATVGQCPRGTNFIVALRGKRIDGETAPNLVGATELDVLPGRGGASHQVSLSSTFATFFISSIGTMPKGDYQLIFACRNRLDTEWLHTFEATVSFGKDGSYEVAGDSGRDLEEVLGEAGIVVEAADPGDYSDLGEEVLGDPATTQPVVEAAATTDDPGTLRNTLLIIGALLLVGAMSAWIVMRRRESQGSAP